MGARIKLIRRVDANDELVIHLAGAYGMEAMEIAERMDISRSTLRGYLAKWNGWTFTGDELLNVLLSKDSETDLAYRDVCSLQEANQRNQELIAMNEEALRIAQGAQQQAERECGDLLGLTSTFSAGLHKDVADLRDQVAALNDQLLEANARLREQLAERETAIKAERRSESLRRERQRQDLKDVAAEMARKAEVAASLAKAEERGGATDRGARAGFGAPGERGVGGRERRLCRGHVRP
jgi:hypothetical protein